jgi:hypothetical protein
MSVSTTQKVGIVAKVAARMAGRNRYVGAAARALRAAGGSWGRILGVLWLEVTGFVFLSLAAIGALAFAHEFAKYAAGKGEPARITAAVCFMLIFAWFGVSSFWRARRNHSLRNGVDNSRKPGEEQ